MNIPDQISKLTDELKDSLPGLSVSLDPPDNPDGVWWIDVTADDHQLTIAWSPKNGFGMFTGDVGYGDRPNEVYRSAPLAAKRIVGMIESLRNRHSVELSLGDIRELLDLTQNAVAGRLKKTQATVSKLEGRNDVKIETLAKYIEALGGRLELRARMPEFDVEIRVSPDGQSG